MIRMEWNLSQIENNCRSLGSSSIKDGADSIPSESDFLSNEQSGPTMNSLFTELIERIKNILGSIRNYARISRGKFSDKEFGEYFYRAVMDDIEKTEVVLNSFVDYMKVRTPIKKMNTVHHIIEEVLKKHQAKLEERGIRLIRKFERDLPETVVPDEHLRYILNSVLQYAIVLTPSNWNIGLSTKSFILAKEGSETQGLFTRDGKYIEISVVFAGHHRLSEPALGTLSVPKEEVPNLILRFVKEVALRNHGTMRVGVDEKKTKTFISLRFPVERRKLAYYQSVN